MENDFGLLISLDGNKLNPLNFGKITVLSNGVIRANVNREKIGELGRDSLYDVVLKEMYEGSGWINTRLEAAPCKSCNYSLLCSPISNYEYALKRNHLCNIWDPGNPTMADQVQN